MKQSKIDQIKLNAVVSWGYGISEMGVVVAIQANDFTIKFRNGKLDEDGCPAYDTKTISYYELVGDNNMKVFKP